MLAYGPLPFDAPQYGGGAYRASRPTSVLGGPCLSESTALKGSAATELASGGLELVLVLRPLAVVEDGLLCRQVVSVGIQPGQQVLSPEGGGGNAPVMAGVLDLLRRLVCDECCDNIHLTASTRSRR